MKKISKVLMACMLLAMCTLSMQAQKMTTVSGNISRTEQMKSSGGSHPFWWIVRAGYLQNFCDLEEYSYSRNENDGISKAGYNFSFGFQKQFNDFGLYYGLDLGIDKTLVEDSYHKPNFHYNEDLGEYMSTGSSTIYFYESIPVIYLRPRFGFCHSISKDWQLDVAFAAGYGFMTKEGASSVRTAINGEVDLGFWYKNILLQAAYTPCATIEGEDIFRQRIAVNVGFRF